VEVAIGVHLSVDPLRRDSQEPEEVVALFLGRRSAVIILGAVAEPLIIEPLFSNSRRWQVPSRTLPSVSRALSSALAWRFRRIACS